MRKIISYFLFMCMLFCNAYAKDVVDGFVFSDTAKPTYTMDGLDGFVFEGDAPVEKPPAVVEITPDTSVEIPNEYRAEYNLLKSVGLISENDGTNMKAVYMRKQFAKLASQLFNLIPTSDTMFSDVSPEDPYNGYINAVTTGKVMNGVSDKKFDPNGIITYDQVIKILINRIGYGEMAETKGGYPAGYNIVASDLKLNKNITFANGKNADLGMVLTLVYNALNTETFEAYAITTGVNYRKSGKTLLAQQYHIQKIEGIFNEFYGSNIYGVSNCLKDEISIDRVPFKYESVDDSLLGHKVCAFVEIDEENKKIITIEKDESSQSIMVDYDDISTIKTDSLEYDEHDKLIKVKIASNAFVMYNGAYLNTFSQCNFDSLGINSGEFKLIDTDNDKTFDVVIIMSYQYGIVNSVNMDIGRIYLKDGYIDVDEKDSNVVVNVISGNENVPITQLVKNNILSISKSINTVGKKVSTIFVSTDNVVGTIEEITGDGTAYIDGKEYPLAYGYENANIEKIKLGLNAKFLLNHRNEIFGVDTSAAVQQKLIGYLTATDLKSQISSILKLQILNTDGKWLDLSCEDKVSVFKTTALNTVIEASYTDYENLKNVLDVEIGTSGVLIGYKLKDEKIREIYLTNDLSKTDKYPGLDKKNFSLDYSISGDTSVRLYSGTLGSKMFADGKTKVLIVPNNISGGINKKMYKVGSVQLFETPNDVYLKNVKFYDVGEDRNIGIIVQQVDQVNTDRVNLESRVMVVKNVVNAINKDGENAYKVNGMQAGKEVSIFASAEYADVQSTITTDKWYRANMSVSKLKIGDVIQYEADSIGEIVNFRVLFRTDDPYNEKWEKNEAITFDNKMSMLHTAYGEIVEKNDFCIIVNCVDLQNPTYEKAYRLINTQIYSVKTDTSVLKKIKANDMGVGDKVFIRSWWNTTQEILVVRN